MVETAVGDRYVLEAMKAGGYSLGGEQSGHVILLDHATTGDGSADRACTLLARVAETGQALAELAAVVTRLPQVLVNVRTWTVARRHVRAVARGRRGGRGASSANRPGAATAESGTEPMVRVMVEAPTAGELGRRRPTRECREQRAGSLGRLVGGCQQGADGRKHPVALVARHK